MTTQKYATKIAGLFDMDVPDGLIELLEKSLEIEKPKKLKKEEIEKPKKVKNEKDEKEEIVKPKKLKNHYIQYCTDKRDEFKLKYPELSVRDVTRKLAGQWNEEKEQNSETYQLYLKEYEERKTNLAESKEIVKHTESKQTSFKNFSKKQREIMKTNGTKTTVKDLQAMWKEMSKEEKALYKETEVESE